MSKGKKWKMTKKQLHKRLYRKSLFRVGGKGMGFNYFRHSKRFQDLMINRLSMRKMMAKEIGFWE